MPMENENLEAEKAELIQSIKALYIPLSLFLACVIMAAGVFLIYNLEPVGWAFIAVSGAIMASAFFALIRFQNRLRANGVLPPSSYDDEVIPPFDLEPVQVEREFKPEFKQAAK
jgi:uncharacterized membrane protein